VARELAARALVAPVLAVAAAAAARALVAPVLAVAAARPERPERDERHAEVRLRVPFRRSSFADREREILLDACALALGQLALG
jgi:hypothetical protein